MALSRMERNKAIHDAVRKEIAYKKNIQDEKSVIHSTFEKLKKIDPEFFKEKLAFFDAKHEFEKPYLDKDKTSSLFPDEMKYQMKLDISELKKLGKKELIVPVNIMDEDNDDKIVLRKEKYIKLYQSLQENEANFRQNIEKLKQKQSRIVTQNDIKPTTIQQVRSKDNRTTQQMIIDVNDKTDKSYAIVMKTWKSFEKKHRFKYALIFFIFLLFLMVAAIIVPIFIK